MDSLFNDIEKGAEISECGKYRYRLWRVWDRSKPFVMFLMLNPSTADANVDDPTIRRCIGFAKSWGYGGIVVCNLFAYRATNPKELLNVCDPVGPENQQHLDECIQESEKVIFAWGNSLIVKKLFNKLGYLSMVKFKTSKSHFLVRSKDNTPMHPLYLKADLKPIPYITKLEK